jgi:hypothetical protein
VGEERATSLTLTPTAIPIHTHSRENIFEFNLTESFIIDVILAIEFSLKFSRIV